MKPVSARKNVSEPYCFHLSRVIIVVLLIFSGFDCYTTKVVTKFGPIRGLLSRSTRGRLAVHYLGIPYAEPPVGDLRFRSPQPWKTTWNDTFDAIENAEMCIQMNKRGIVVGSEDCLYLNVYVPMISEKQRVSDKLPVLVFVHGGGYNTGSGDSRKFPPEYLMDQDLILVTMNYRLHILGFFSTGNKVTPGNYALKDIVQSLKWIQENIQSFGGDPNSVTLWGHSSGASLVHALVITNKTEGLFHKYIMQSGSIFMSINNLSKDWIRIVSLEVAKVFDCLPRQNRTNETTEASTEYSLLATQIEEGTIDKDIHTRSDSDDYSEDEDEEIVRCMKTVDATSISELIHDFYVWRDFPGGPFGPTIEDESEEAIITVHPFVAAKNRMFRDIPCIIGVTKDEGLVDSHAVLTNPTVRGEFIENFETYLPFWLEYPHVLFNTTVLAKAVEEYYFDGNLTENFEQSITTLASDHFILWPTYQTLKYQLAYTNSNTYFYVFDYAGTFTTTFDYGDYNHYGVTHCDDLNYLLPLTNRKHADLMLHNTETDITIINIMTEMWASFASTGVPKAWRVVPWPDYKDSHEFLRIGNGGLPDVVVDTDFPYEAMEFWEELMRILSLPPVEVDPQPSTIGEQYKESSNASKSSDCNKVLMYLLVFVMYLSKV